MRDKITNIIQNYIETHPSNDKDRIFLEMMDDSKLYNQLMNSAVKVDDIPLNEAQVSPEVAGYLKSKGDTAKKVYGLYESLFIKEECEDCKCCEELKEMVEDLHSKVDEILSLLKKDNKEEKPEE